MDIGCAQLLRLIEIHKDLITKCAELPPNEVERSALAAMLHSFYTGVENLFKRIALEIDGGLPHGEFWHSELLDMMASSSSSRKPVITQELRNLLKEYLEFRHVFRQAYSFELSWRKMAHLVFGVEEAFRLLEHELTSFMTNQ